MGLFLVLSQQLKRLNHRPQWRVGSCFRMDPRAPVALKHQSESDFSDPRKILLTVQNDSRSVRAGAHYSLVISILERLGGVA
jgi:hypothetical protein